MVGADIGIILEAALANANAEPVTCPFCANKVYAGVVQGRRAGTGPESGTGHGLLWVERPEGEKGIGRSLLRKLKKSKKWFLPGAHLKARSCGKCRRLFVWGVAVDDAFLKNMNTDNTERYCPHCSDELLTGIISLEPGKEGGARFECADAPDFHKDWLGHAVLDRFFLNKWALPIQSIPAKSCEQCQYTEVAGRPVYRFQ
jgi:hypothetical protein